MTQSTGDTLVVLVPGINGTGESRLRGYIRSDIEQTLGDYVQRPVEELTLAGFQGIRFRLGSGPGERRYDIAEVDWETKIAKLSSRPLLVRLFQGLVLLTRGASAGRSQARESPAFLYLTVTGWIVLACWVTLVLAALLGPAQKGAKSLFEKLPSDWLAAYAMVLHNPMLHQFQIVLGICVVVFYVFALTLIGALSVGGISSDLIADIVDLYERYLGGGRAYGSEVRLRAILTQRVKEGIQTLIDSRTDEQGPYGRVVVLGHSLGALFGAEGAALSGRPVELVTIGTFYNYLKHVNGPAMDEIFARVLDSQVTVWHDFYSEQDYVSGSSAYRESNTAATKSRSEGRTRKYRSELVMLEAGWVDRVLTRSHMFYFRERHVVSTIFDVPLAAAVPP